jgi:tRNA-(ms[2]io[6]A)-hydroxylase
MLCLTRPTDPRWVAAALDDVDAILVDHAHCEMKAATNALALAARAPGDAESVRVLVDLAKEELSHFEIVLAELGRRGLSLGPPPVDAYAAGLRTIAHDTPRPPRLANGALVDRMLVAALIEARSCERFQLLVAGLASAGEAELARLYDDLLASEARHYRTFVDLAVRAAGGDEARVRERLSALAAAEGELCARLGTGATIHG